MAELLIRYYSYIAKEEGLMGKILLAQNTKIPSIKASLEPDSPANIAIFKKAIETITGKPAPSFFE